MEKVSFYTLTMALLIAISSPANANTVIGTAESISTSVTGNNSRRISSSSSIFANERIKANQTGLGHFLLKDGTKLVVGPGSSLKLDKLIYNPNTSTFKKFTLKAASGATRFISGDSDSSAFKIVTPVGVLGLRGTAFDFRHWRGRTYLMLLDGNVEICNRRQQCKTLKRRCDFVIVGRDGNITNPIQPRNSLFSNRDMATYFPFVNDQSSIKSNFRLRINRCSGGSSSNNGGGSDGPDGGGTGGGY